MKLRHFALIVCIAASSACSDEGPVSGPGTMTATVISPHGAEGAALIALEGGAREVTSIGGTDAYSTFVDGRMRVLLVNPTAGDLTFAVEVADTTQPPTAVIEEVAGPDDELRPATSEYSVAFTR